MMGRAVAAGAARVIATVMIVLAAGPAAPGMAQADEAPRARLAFTHGSRLWTMDSDGGDRRLVLRGKVGQPSWSPDGSLIAFYRSRTYRYADLWVTTPEGADAHVLVPGGKDFLADPAWSPDGSRLAFMRYSNTRATIEIVDRDGSGGFVVKSLRDEGGYANIHSPVWTADGQALLYTKSTAPREHYQSSIRHIGIDGRNDRLFLRDAAGGSFSPDGLTLAFSDQSAHAAESCGEEDPCAWNGDPATAAADGSGRHAIVRTKADEAAFSWSPDGTRIAFGSDRNLPTDEFMTEVYSVARDGSCLTWLTNGNVESDAPSWSPQSGEAAPARCDGTREPTIEHVPADGSLLWPEAVFGGTMYTGTRRSPDGFEFLFYDDCAAFLARECGSGFQLAQRDVCKRSSELRYRLRHRSSIRRVGRALVVDWSGEYSIYAGHSGVMLATLGLPFAPSRVRRLAQALRTVSGDDLPRLAMDPSLRALLPERLRGDVARC